MRRLHALLHQGFTQRVQPSPPHQPRPAIILDDLREISRLVLARVYSGLGRPGGPREFSNQSFSRLLERQTQYLEDLGVEAVRIARRNHSDVVSAADVDAADIALQSKPRRGYKRFLEPTGGIFAGGGMAQLFWVLSSTHDKPSTLAYLLAVIGLVAGTVMIAIGQKA